MTAAARLVATLRDAGVELHPTPGGRIHYRAARGVLTPADVEALRRHRDAILAVLYAERGHRTELAGGRLLLVHHDHRCGCGRVFRCTAPACAGDAVPCVVCRLR